MRPPGGGAVEVALKGLIGPGGRRGRRSEWIHQIRPNKDAPLITEPRSSKGDDLEKAAVAPCDGPGLFQGKGLAEPADTRFPRCGFWTCLPSCRLV